ncbi:reactive oxygen species modulator 1 [Brevipalpus obovatus]|uniref:reactive oxygen species modulator 1 n=1 Tax=Brevipalpus obovatus TaxID=246614 RepID=UPI003D9E973B
MSRQDGFPRFSEPTCFTKVQMGVKVGFLVGIGSGAIFGTITALRFGYRGGEIVKMAAKAMISSGTLFGGFMGIGSALRC